MNHTDSLKFSILMSIYYKEKPEFFDRCMVSIWNEQSIKPSEIVLVQDGKLTNELYLVINKWQKVIGELFKIVDLKENVGTGKAKNIGLKYCKYQIIAIMDTDDIAQSKRFEKQLKILNKGFDVCSSWVSEFVDNEENIISFRKVPEYHYEIIDFAKSRMPVNHPSTMYKKDIAIQSGGYKHMLWFEDYYLMVRMIQNGAKFYNIQEPLVSMRIGYEQLERRRGLKYAIAELKFFNELKRRKFINNIDFIKNIAIRLIIRISPRFVTKAVYKLLRKG